MQYNLFGNNDFIPCYLNSMFKPPLYYLYVEARYNVSLLILNNSPRLDDIASRL